MKVALAQVNTTVGDFSGNREKFRQFARKAKLAGAELVVFPELALCGYLPRDLVDKPSFLERNRKELELLAQETPEIAVICGFVGQTGTAAGKPATNSAAFLSGGRVQFVQSKMLLPTYDVFDEGRNFTPAQSQDVLPLCGRQWALTICEDIWNDKHFWKKQLYTRDPVEELVQKGANILLNISASPYFVGKRAFRLEMLRAFALRYRMPVLYVNLVGGNDSLVFDGSSLALDSEGNVRAQAVSFDEDLVTFDIATEAGDIHAQVEEPEEAVYRALVLGTRDYVRKCGFRSVLVGLSGGIDSSLTATIAVEAVGKENVLGVAMPGPYSSPRSLEDARTLAANLAIRLEILPITDIFRRYLETLRPAFAGKAEDVTEENIQSRIRGGLLMALSNKFRALVLSTGNKSELAMGYCTLYGDMAGGLAVISDIPKTMVYRLAALVNGSREIIPQAVIAKAPSAELRPNQKDSDTLPPYEILDAILKDYIEEYETPAQIADKHGIDLDLVRSVVARVDCNEYKRQQAAPGLKVTSKAFGIGRRFPIAQRYTEA
ncbi:MAG: NAD+ synthase [Acidobacteria bacterium]|nr:NAD+ synthase [Acidobacteriota bacterium]